VKALAGNSAGRHVTAGGVVSTSYRLKMWQSLKLSTISSYGGR